MVFLLVCINKQKVVCVSYFFFPQGSVRGKGVENYPPLTNDTWPWFICKPGEFKADVISFCCFCNFTDLWENVYRWVRNCIKTHSSGDTLR